MGNKEKCLILGLDYRTIHINFKNKAVIIAGKHSCITVQTFIYRHENTFHIILDINNACTCIYQYIHECKVYTTLGLGYPDFSPQLYIIGIDLVTMVYISLACIGIIFGLTVIDNQLFTIDKINTHFIM